MKDHLRGALRLLAEMDLVDPDRRGCTAVNTVAELAGADETATELVRRMSGWTEDAFRALVEEGRRGGEVAADRDATAIGSLLLNTVVGLRLMARVAEGREPNAVERWREPVRPPARTSSCGCPDARMPGCIRTLPGAGSAGSASDPPGPFCVKLRERSPGAYWEKTLDRRTQ
ncbi:TetR family transcriptional regulator C-terminal domain-containing protein [Streptomyces sp. NPDC014724]|uniref:TetR family transcriptional regulator C-terminal domain-containing protein n=1 Tax=unclassified Streptomyces TaxID=2593676 RepID=UPI0036FF527E